MKFLNSILLTVFLCSGSVLVQADESMTKIVFRTVTPELSLDSFAAKPKTLYLWGATRSRTEEAPDPAMKLQQLLISNGKDVWLINLWDKTGKHMIDPGPTYNFHDPIVPPTHGNPPRVADFELAHELEYMVNHHAQSSEGMFNGVKSIIYETTQEGLRLRLYLAPGKQTPMAASVYEGDHCLTQIVYDEYTKNLKPDPSLFEAPAGIQISENQQQ